MGLFDWLKKSSAEELFESEEWKQQEHELKIFSEYQAELKQVTDKYFPQLELIQKAWSSICSAKNYTGEKAKEFEVDCKQNIQLYKCMVQIDTKYGQTSPPNAPAFKRLAMLYEKQGQYEKAVSVCVDALNHGAWGENMKERLARMVKKSKRDPSPEEITLLNETTKADWNINNSIATTELATRKNIPAEIIDADQRIEASESYKNIVYQKYYSDYPELPFISKDREKNMDWLERAEMFPAQSIIPRHMMLRFPSGLLPGHIYMLYWLNKYTNKRIPVYFEYKYGIDFIKEKQFLTKMGYLKDDKPTKKGVRAMKIHQSVINNHSK